MIESATQPKMENSVSIKGVTFNIKYDDTYTERYNNLRAVFERHNQVEDRTTSCVFLDTPKSVDEVHTALYGALDYTKDKAIVFETYRHNMKTFGPK
ncbi:hypothetical protein [Salipiger bermudensis]|uniref:hypothetical protein n=1 Tax=Salipiger bermudensis TaxID=344736 RepID=UPI001CD686A6|nr:hypothetical protein [Salipiger bermudensis]MCA0961177.1 hypothetical protein [Salipiger bermudensis]